ncbi:MAG: hypothetical protein M0Z40_14410 [Actinomycetota bacterium]|nr:hypothetical protein [Actinomycetota bacterium]MDA8287494.1 hypothetical protein [Actinomycetota bacterium]
MSVRRDQVALAEAERRYRALAHQLAEIGFIHGGSLVKRFTRCANPRCRCRADPPQLHGPYWQWSAKVAGKTVTRRLSQAEAERYSEWIANDRRVAHLIAEMRRIADQAITLIPRAEDRPSASQASDPKQR